MNVDTKSSRTTVSETLLFTDTPVPVKNDEEVTSSFEATDDHTVHSFEFNTGKTLNSLEESANGLFGASEHPPKITKSEETLKKIEDILQGSGTTTSSLGQNTRTKVSGYLGSVSKVKKKFFSA